MSDVEDLDDDLDLDDDDTTGDVPAQLRKAAKRGKKAAKDRDEARAENDRLRRELAVYQAGLGGLDAKKVKAILSAIDGDVTAEAVKSQAVDFGWAAPDANPDDALAGEIDAQAQISAASQAGGKSAPTSVLSPQDVNDWPIDKRLRFLDKHPEEYERLLRGESIPGFAFA